MNKGLRTLIRISFSATLVSGISLYGYGQKLKNIQEGSVLAPGNVKIDAKVTEWGTFQAANKATDLTYTVSNDDKNLYLAIQSTDQLNNNKIVGGGISFTINTADKKREKDAFIITYPVVSRANMRGAGGGRQRGGGGFGGGAQRAPVDSAAMLAMRKQALTSAKEITVSGFKDITDSVISIYNEYGIKAAADYDDKGNFVYELSVPLQLLNISANTPKEFAYNLKVNGIQRPERGDGSPPAGGGGFGGGGRGGRGGGGFGGGGGGRGGGGGGGGFGGGGDGGMDQSMMAPTDFWGKYTPAKK